MSRIIVTEGAVQGLERCRKFLQEKSLQVAQRAAKIIAQRFASMAKTPHMGRPLLDLPELRELIIEFGDSGYVALYRHDPLKDVVYILAFRHQKEVGY